MRLFIFIIITLFFSYCKHNHKEILQLDDQFKQYVPVDSSIQYFPVDSLFFVTVKNQFSADSFFKKWYSETLFNLQEPVLYNYSGRGETVRLLWLRAFDNPVAIRVNRFNDSVYANIKSYNNVQKILKDTIVLLNTASWNKILSKLEANNFWNIGVADSSWGKDGIAWFLECRLHNKYHGINRWDEGSLSSKDLNLYADELVNIASNYTSMRISGNK